MDETTTTASASNQRVVYYDGDCRMCRGTVSLLDTLGLVPAARTAPFQELEGDLAARVWEAGVHNQLAVWDPETDAVAGGIDGLLDAFRGSWIQPLLPVAALPGVRQSLRVLYRLVAYNRRILSPLRVPPGEIRCACDPDYHAGYRWGLVAVCGALVLALPVLAHGPAGLGLAIALLVATGSGVTSVDRPVTWYGHLGVIGAQAALAVALAGFLPAAAAGPTAFVAGAAILGAGIARRGRWLGVPQALLAGGAAVAAIAGAIAVALVWARGG